MKLIAGLGNPGKKYEGTRHNIGFLVLEELKKQMTNFQFPIFNQFSSFNFQMEKKFEAEVVRLGEVLLVKPTTFMNESGRAVAGIVRFYKLDLNDLYVVHDDLDIRLGEYKIQKGVGPKIHNGVLSVEKELGSKDFWRVRVGVDSRRRNQLQVVERSDPSSATLRTAEGSDLPFAGSGADYVLERFNKKEREIVDGVIEKVVRELRTVLE